jgi:hypothetical protein
MIPDHLQALLDKLSLDKLDYREEGNFYHHLAEVTGAADAECLDKCVERILGASHADFRKAFDLTIGKTP